MAETNDARLRDIHVLVVDDVEATRDLLSVFLQHYGLSVVAVPTGHEALAALTQVRPEVIVSDLSMPGMTGHEFIQHVRALPGQAERPTPAIAVTAFHDADSQRLALESGFQVYLTKPLNPMTVVDEVARLVGRRGAAGG
jgi:CheY-like chemotaxis protein